MFGKSVYLVAFLAAIAFVAHAVPKNYPESYASKKANLSHHLIVGARVPGDRLVYQANVLRGSYCMQIVTYQETFNVSKYEKITQVRALDLETDGNGAMATLLGGGPGVNQVTLRFISKRNHGINFHVELYAR